MTKDYLFYDNTTGEEFLVEADSRSEAEETAAKYYEEPELLDCMSVDEGYRLGLDTY